MHGDAARGHGIEKDWDGGGGAGSPRPVPTRIRLRLAEDYFARPERTERRALNRLLPA